MQNNNNTQKDISLFLVLGTALAIGLTACGPEGMDATQKDDNSAISAYYCRTCYIPRLTVVGHGADATIWIYANNGNGTYGARTDLTCPSGQTCSYLVNQGDYVYVWTTAHTGAASVSTSGATGIHCQMDDTYLYEFGPPAKELDCGGNFNGAETVSFSFN